MTYKTGDSQTGLRTPQSVFRFANSPPLHQSIRYQRLIPHKSLPTIKHPRPRRCRQLLSNPLSFCSLIAGPAGVGSVVWTGWLDSWSGLEGRVVIPVRVSGELCLYGNLEQMESGELEMRNSHQILKLSEQSQWSGLSLSYGLLSHSALCSTMMRIGRK